MKSIFVLCAAMLIALTSCTSTPETTKKAPEKQLRHVVLFGFKPTTTPAQITEVETAFAALPGKIDLIKGYEWGTDCSPEGLQNGLTHCFFVTFDSADDRDAYLVHPAHKEFGGILGDKTNAITVVDYWVK